MMVVVLNFVSLSFTWLKKYRKYHVTRKKSYEDKFAEACEAWSWQYQKILEEINNLLYIINRHGPHTLNDENKTYGTTFL